MFYLLEEIVSSIKLKFLHAWLKKIVKPNPTRLIYTPSRNKCPFLSPHFFCTVQFPLIQSYLRKCLLWLVEWPNLVMTLRSFHNPFFSSSNYCTSLAMGCGIQPLFTFPLIYILEWGQLYNLCLSLKDYTTLTDLCQKIKTYN